MNNINILISTIGRRGYIANYFRPYIGSGLIVGTSDRNSIDRELTSGFSYCDKSYIVPSFSDPGYVNAILDICKTDRINVLLSLHDIDNYILSSHLDKFRKLDVIPFISSHAVNSICFDKLKTNFFCEKNQIPTPRTYGTFEEFHDKFNQYPVVVKPRFGYGSSSLFIARNSEEALIFFKYEKDMIIQEWIPGQEFSMDMCWDLNSRLVGLATKRKIKMRAGETDQAISIVDERLNNLATYLSTNLKAVGPVDIDVLEKDGIMNLLEINPRFGGGYPVSHHAGLDIPKMIIDMANSHDVDLNIGKHRSGVCMYKDIMIGFGYPGQHD